MAEACINFNYVASHVDIHTTIAYRTINRFWQTGLAGDSPKSDRQRTTKTKNFTGGTFHSNRIKAGVISSNKPALLDV